VDELEKLKNQRWMDILIRYTGNCMVYLCIITATFVYGIQSISTFVKFNSIYSNLNLYLSFLPGNIRDAVIGWNSISRINSFLTEEEVI
jgi:hypothetical protein